VNNWYQFIEQNSNTNVDLNGVSGNPATNELWAVGDNGTIIYSPNYLLGWAFQTSGVSENLNDVCMINQNEGYAVGDNGIILHFTNEVGISNKIESSDVNIFPNPTRNETVISFPESIYIFLIQVVTLNGESVYYLDLNRESFSQKLDLSGLSNGVYVLKVYTKRGLISDKLLIK
jgi:hypothetical protein